MGVALAASCASSVQAQTATVERESRTWNLQGLRAGYCVRFLIEPELAQKELRQGYLLLTAARDQRLHPALHQILNAQPEFASWTPSNLCFYYLDAVQVGRRRIVERDRRSYQMVGVWTLGATEQEGGGRRDVVVDMFANRNSLLRVARAAEVRIHEVHSVVSDRADASQDSYSIKVGKTQLIWIGRHTGDSTRVEAPIHENWSVVGLRPNIKVASLQFNPNWSWPMVGSLRVEGKGDLAKALKASPIRFVGPLYRGGGGQLRFSR